MRFHWPRTCLPNTSPTDVYSDYSSSFRNIPRHRPCDSSSPCNAPGADKPIISIMHSRRAHRSQSAHSITRALTALNPAAQSTNKARSRNPLNSRGSNSIRSWAFVTFAWFVLRLCTSLCICNAQWVQGGCHRVRVSRSINLNGWWPMDLWGCCWEKL